MVKFLIIRFSSIGDIVLTTPVIRCLKNQVDGAKVHYVTKKAFLPVLKSNPYIDKIHALDTDMNELVANLKKENFDYIIDLHKNLRSSIIKSKLKRVAFTFNKINFEKWLLVNLKINRLPKKHIVDRTFETLSVFDIKNDDKGLDYFIPENENFNADELPPTFQNGYIGWVVGAMHKTKKFPTEKIIRIIRSINIPVMILGGPDDKSEASVIEESLSGEIYNACGKYSINQSAWFVKNAKLIVTNDTGLMHIAAAFKKTIFSLWGNTIPEFGMYPYLPDKESKIFEVKNLSCRPCSKIGYNRCPKKHFNCMNQQNEDTIIQNIQALFK